MQIRARRSVTIRDVALAAGVSPMTVSNVLNGKLQYVGPPTRERVERAIRRLRYRPQQGARSLRAARHQSVGLVFVDDSRFALADHFNAQVAAGLSNALAAARYALVIEGVRRADIDRAVSLRTSAVDAFCVVLSGDDTERRQMARRFLALGPPLVLLQESAGMPRGDVCTVRQDDFGGGRMIAAHLLAQDVRRIAVIGLVQVWPAVEQRIAGVRAGIAEAGGKRSSPAMITAADEDLDSVAAAVGAYLDREALPDAFVAANDRLAIGAIAELRRRGIDVPGQVRVTGFNGFETWRYTLPTITTVMSRAFELGERAGATILQRLAGEAFAERDVLLPVTLAVGATT